MRDGVRLATDLYLPERSSVHGSVLIRGPYDKNSRYQGIADMAEVFNDRGLVVVSQDVRGKFRSEGVTEPYATDVEDAFDSIEWIVSQSWSNGSVGLFGVSYLGYTVWAGIASGHPAIKGAVPQGTAIDLGNIHIASLWRQEPPWGISADDLVQIWADNEMYYVSIDYSVAPLTEALDEATAAIGVRPSALDDLLRRSKTGEVVNPYGSRHPYWTTNVPILHWGNWFDVGLGPSSIRDFVRLRTIPGRRDLHYLRAESADHGGVRLEDVPYAEDADPLVNDDTHKEVKQRQAVDAADFLRPLLNGQGSLPGPAERVRWHTGHAGWRTADDWPPHGVVPCFWFLSNARAAPDAADRGTLATKPATAQSVVAWKHDAADPVPSSVTPDEWWTFLAAYPDERDLIKRPDVLTFTSEPFQLPIDLCGRPLVRVRASTSGPSMHLFAKLLDVHPDGAARPISHGRVLLFDPDLDRLAQIDLDPTAYRVRAGHRLRLHISSSEHPIFLRHPGTDDNPWYAERLVANRQQLRIGGVDSSHVELPVYRGGEEPS
jgi:putative CocE/NonD family hydrolase